MGKITFILGGARSGKSQYALTLAKKAKRVAFIATCQPLDAEMKKRIMLHKKQRPKNWKTFEEPESPLELLKNIGGKFEVIIIDCLTLMLSNLVIKELKEPAIKSKLNKMLLVLKKIKANSIVISNELGLGIVPQNKLARNFRDIAGRANQMTAKESDAVFFMVSGLPWRMK